jgi:sec-independent protein translocase protein TatB
MFNVGGPEVFVILLVALIVLGPNKLPEAARQVGRAMHELRRISNGFQAELRSALDQPLDGSPATRREAVTNTRPVEPPEIVPVGPDDDAEMYLRAPEAEPTLVVPVGGEDDAATAEAADESVEDAHLDASAGTEPYEEVTEPDVEAPTDMAEDAPARPGA